LPQINALLARMGSLQAVTFKGVGPGRMDIYEVEFENGLTERRIMLTPDGEIDGLIYPRLEGDCGPALARKRKGVVSRLASAMASTSRSEFLMAAKMCATYSYL